MLEGKPLAQNRSHFLMANDHLINPAAMIIPHRYVETPFDFTAKEWVDLRRMPVEAKARLAEFKPDGFTTRWNVGAVGEQDISQCAHARHLPLQRQSVCRPLSARLPANDCITQPSQKSHRPCQKSGVVFENSSIANAAARS